MILHCDLYSITRRYFVYCITLRCKLLHRIYNITLLPSEYHKKVFMILNSILLNLDYQVTVPFKFELIFIVLNS